MVSGTSSEFLGQKPLPRAARHREVVFLLGPEGVGKTRVAMRLLQDEQEPMHLGGDTLQELLVHTVRRRRWPTEIREHPALVIDGPWYLHRRPAVVRVLQELLVERAADGLRTMVCEAPDRSPMTELMGSVDPAKRAVIALRFPEGRGRRRYALRLCDELGIDRKHARLVEDIEPWSYSEVRATLEGVRAAERTARRKRGRRKR